MILYEYAVIKEFAEDEYVLQDKLNKNEGEGWQFVQIVPSFEDTFYYYIVYKKEKKIDSNSGS